MSMTKSVGVVGPSHWSYMAAIMAQRLEAIIAKGKVDNGDIPAGIYTDAKEFFHLVGQALGGKLPENPPASMNALVIATDVARATIHDAADKPDKLEERLSNYAAFVNQEINPEQLKHENLAPASIEIARELRRFFQELHREGESEAYAHKMKLDEPQVDLRFALGASAWRYC